MKMPQVPRRWRPGELVLGIGAIALGIAMTLAALGGWELSPWLLILIPLVAIGVSMYHGRVIAQFPTGVERPKPSQLRSRSGRHSSRSAHRRALPNTVDRD
jgi:hypothetical protein